MTVSSTTKDPATLTLTLIADFDASLDRVWEVWEDPRKLERWWGPPTYPATFTRHDFVVGGESRYFMTGPWSGRRRRRTGTRRRPDAQLRQLRDARRGYPDDRRYQLRQRQADEDHARHGHTGRPDPGNRSDRRTPRTSARLTATGVLDEATLGSGAMLSID